MDTSELTEAITTDLFTYVLNGTLPEDDISELIKPPDFPERYSDFDQLVDLHFILDDDVLDFVDQLEDRLRTISIETTLKSEVRRGGVEGHIDWHTTYRQRFASSPGNRSLFATRTHTEEYATPENLVLKAVVNIIRQAIENVDRYLDANRSWVADTWAADHRRREQFSSTVNRNVHLQRIPDPDPDQLTGRILSRVMDSRKDLYRDAATLLTDRQSYERGSMEELADLLADTAITPEDRETLLELYTLFRVLDALDTVGGEMIGIPTYHTIASKRDAVATYNGRANLQVHYNQTPSDPMISFRALPDSDEPQSRSDIAHRTAQEIADVFFTDSDVREHTKRPDVLVVGDSSVPLESRYLVIEVKDSTDKQRIRQGITELVEYISFLRRTADDGTTDYEFQPEEFGSGLNGLLVVQDFDAAADVKPASLAQQAGVGLPIRIVQARHLPSVLPSVIRRLFAPLRAPSEATGT